MYPLKKNSFLPFDEDPWWECTHDVFISSIHSISLLTKNWQSVCIVDWSCGLASVFICGNDINSGRGIKKDSVADGQPPAIIYTANAHAELPNRSNENIYVLQSLAHRGDSPVFGHFFSKWNISFCMYSKWAFLVPVWRLWVRELFSLPTQSQEMCN